MYWERPSKEQRCPFCPHCNGQCEGLIHFNDDPIQDNMTKEAQAHQEKTTTDMQTQQTPPHTTQGVAAKYVSPNDAYYYSPEFLEQLDKLESIAREEIQHKKKVAYSPPSFSLGIPLEQQATPAPSAQPTTGIDQEQCREKTTPTDPLGTSTEKQPNEGSEHVVTHSHLTKHLKLAKE
ncbi:hypothetical protein Cgig2_014072 [Carnegiea gigantea]|uniref:Uncharacterized protein n=1 Tax=Carnegiea gigantea TaxID=171969 RepID=A0A9Q1KYB7_9CARY|nr:hypothetical protein Cgig2_014072 [Carnegiea gigantea]